jgi:carbamoyl-phosphate synthase large subunit
MCNSVSPDENEDIVAIEINSRVSRSSALASKATGYQLQNSF